MEIYRFSDRLSGLFRSDALNAKNGCTKHETYRALYGVKGGLFGIASLVKPEHPKKKLVNVWTDKHSRICS